MAEIIALHAKYAFAVLYALSIGFILYDEFGRARLSQAIGFAVCIILCVLLRIDDKLSDIKEKIENEIPTNRSKPQSRT